MHGVASKILKTVAKKGEITLETALALADGKINDHRRQYPLALLIQEGYLGLTFHPDTSNGEHRMPEFSYATLFHMFTLPQDENGVVTYLGMSSSGGIKPENEIVFITAKGALYRQERAEKVRERLYSLIVAVSVGIIVASVSAWFRGDVSLF